MGMGCWCVVMSPKEAAEGLKRSLTTILTECMTKSGADIPDLQAISEKRLPDTHAGLCMVECALEHMKIMIDGKFDAESALRTISPFLRFQPSKLRQMTELAVLCDREVKDNSQGKDKCDIAKLVVRCIGKHGDNYGMSIAKTLERKHIKS